MARPTMIGRPILCRMQITRTLGLPERGTTVSRSPGFSNPNPDAGLVLARVLESAVTVLRPAPKTRNSKVSANTS